MSNKIKNDILFTAIENTNFSEVAGILKQCTQDILEFRGGRVSI